MTPTEALVQFEPAAYKYAKQWYRLNPAIRADYALEDLAQISRIYILKAVEEYKPNRGMTLSTYIITRIRWGLNTSLRHYITKSRRKAKHFSVDMLNEEYGGDWHPPIEEEKDHDNSSFYEMIADLSPAMQHIFELRFIEDLTLEEIGKNIGRSNEWVRQLINKALTKVKA